MWPATTEKHKKRPKPNHKCVWFVEYLGLDIAAPKFMEEAMSWFHTFRTWKVCFGCIVYIYCARSHFLQTTSQYGLFLWVFLSSLSRISIALGHLLLLRLLFVRWQQWPIHQLPNGGERITLHSNRNHNTPNSVVSRLVGEVLMFDVYLCVLSRSQTHEESRFCPNSI